MGVVEPRLCRYRPAAYMCVCHRGRTGPGARVSRTKVLHTFGPEDEAVRTRPRGRPPGNPAFDPSAVAAARAGRRRGVDRAGGVDARRLMAAARRTPTRRVVSPAGIDTAIGAPAGSRADATTRPSRSATRADCRRPRTRLDTGALCSHGDERIAFRDRRKPLTSTNPAATDAIARRPTRVPPAQPAFVD
jgi:hypothetical protein